MSELIIYWVVKAFGFFVQILPVGFSLRIGKLLGVFAYYFDVKHRNIVISNLKIAFSKKKTPEEIRRIAKQTFINFGQNLIELFRFPLLNAEKFHHFVDLKGREHIDEALKEGRGVILLAMHFGSWEMANLIGASIGHPYKVLVKAQGKNLRLGALLNSFRKKGGSSVIERGRGTRELLKSLKNNEVVALVVDQGGKDGVLVPFFGKQASMSSGAIRLGQKFNVPICFVSISRRCGPYHQLIVEKPLTLVDSGDPDADVITNVSSVVRQMEECIEKNPAEYMWFYKIWKYSKESVIAVVCDLKAGHVHQSQAVAGLLKESLSQRGVSAKLINLTVIFKSQWAAKFFALGAGFTNFLKHRGRLWLLKFCLTPDSFTQILSVKPDFIVSCGSSVAGVNYLLSKEHEAKNIAILKPGLLSFRHFHLVVLPLHDVKNRSRLKTNVVGVQGAPNLISAQFLAAQTQALVTRFSHLKAGDNFRIGVLLGGDTPEFILSEQKVRILIHQLMEIAEEIHGDILLTTSRRTSAKVENLIMRELSKYRRCKLLVLPNRENIPEALGGILGLSDVVVVSAESISMVSEAASSGKKVIAFYVDHRQKTAFEQTKHGRFLESLGLQGYVVLSDVKYMKDSIYKLIKNKVQTKPLNDNARITEALEQIL